AIPPQEIPMLPANTLAAISNVVALNLEPQTTMAILGAILAPVLPDAGHPRPRKRGRPRRKPQGRRRTRKKARPRVGAATNSQRSGGGPWRGPARGPTDAPRQGAARAPAANPGKSANAVAKIAGVNRGPVLRVRSELEAEGAQRPTPKPAAKPLTEPRQRAQRFLKDTLARGPKQVSDVEAAAEKAHVDPTALGQGRGGLGGGPMRRND